MLLVLLGPGVLLHALLSPRARAVDLPLYAAAFWVVGFWWLRLLPGGWIGPVLALGAASFCAGLLLWQRAPDAASSLVWLAAALVFVLLDRGAPVAPGVDGAMHTAVARVLSDAQGHPAGFRPLWPVDSFHSYPVGQPALTALLHDLGGLDWREAGLAGHALAYALAIIGFAAAVSRWSRGSALGLAVGAAAVLAARAPLSFWTWGGAPNVLGIAFGVAGFSAGIDAVRGSGARSAAACGLFASASLLTHGVTAAAFAYAAIPLAAGAALRPALRAGSGWLLAAGALSLLLCAPYLASLHPAMPASGVEWVRAFLRESATLRVFPQMLHDVPLIAGVAALLSVLGSRPRRAVLPIALAAALALLVLNGRFAVLPASELLYPDRIAVLLLLPIAFLAHDALEGRPRIALLAAVALVVHASVLQARMLRTGREHALATDLDLRLLVQAGALLPPGCAVVNNYGDAGQWIPALLGRPITFPQANVLFFDLRERVHPCAAFRGEKRPYHVDTVPCPGAACASLARAGAVELFRIVDPALTVEISPAR